MTLDQWFGTASQNVGDDVLGRVTDELGLPSLPPLSIVPPNTNPNNYVKPYSPPAQPQAPETKPAMNQKKYLVYGGIAVGVLLIAYLIKKG